MLTPIMRSATTAKVTSEPPARATLPREPKKRKGLPTCNGLIELAHPPERPTTVAVHLNILRIRVERLFEVGQFDFVVAKSFAGTSHGMERRHVPRVVRENFDAKLEHLGPLFVFEGGLERLRQPTASSLLRSSGFGPEVLEHRLDKLEIARVGGDAFGEHRVGVVVVVGSGSLDAPLKTAA